MKNKLLCLLLVSAALNSFGAQVDLKRESLKEKIKPTPKQEVLKLEAYNSKKPLLERYKVNYSNADLEKLKRDTLKEKFDAVPVLTSVMKDSKFPEKNRWMATFLLGQIMGKKSADFISKFTKHPEWVMRLASYKALLSLNQTQYKGLYAKGLKDSSMIVRFQALENIKQMNIKELAPHVWGMLYDKSNYVGNSGALKRGSIIKEVVKTIGHLKFEKAKKPMLLMVQKDKYKDIFLELDEALTLISKKTSPKGEAVKKKQFWSKVSLEEATI